MVALSGLGLTARASTSSSDSKESVSSQDLTLRLEAGLRQVFRRPESLLEIGIKPPPSEVGRSKAELRRFFRGANLVELAFPGGMSPAAGLGFFPRVRLGFSNLSILGLKLKAAELSLRGLKVDRDRLAESQIRIQALDSIGMRYQIEEEALNQMTTHFRIGLGAGSFSVRGLKRLLILPVGYQAEGSLRFDPTGKIYFEDRSMRLNGLPLPGIFRRALRRQINPVFDLGAYLGVAKEVFEVEFQKIEHHAGHLILEADAKVEVETD